MKPVDVVEHYLRLVEERHLYEASALLADDVEIVFPGGRSFSNLEEQVAASAGRYRSIRKTIDRFDVVKSGHSTIVFVMGTLTGVDVAGWPFEEVRFVDRFELVGGLIVSHHVWNDLAELSGGHPGQEATDV